MVVQATTSGAEALEWLRRSDPVDLGILDMQMPDLDGRSLGVEIRRSRKLESLPLVLLTAIGSEEAAGNGGEEIFSAYASWN